MIISKLLPTLDNAGRRLVLAEIIGEPVSVKLARRRYTQTNPTSSSVGVSATSERRLKTKSELHTKGELKVVNELVGLGIAQNENELNPLPQSIKYSESINPQFGKLDSSSMPQSENTPVEKPIFDLSVKGSEPEEE